VAQALDTELYISARAWNTLCWYGSLHQQAKKVKGICEKAVDLQSKDEDYRKSRGLNRARLGDTKGAIEDFHFYVEQEPTGWRQWYDRKQVQDWITDLEKGENPFTEEVLKELR
jgi:Flp pilus assembly protein TadD